MWLSFLNHLNTISAIAVFIIVVLLSMVQMISWVTGFIIHFLVIHYRSGHHCHHTITSLYRGIRRLSAFQPPSSNLAQPVLTSLGQSWWGQKKTNLSTASFNLHQPCGKQWPFFDFLQPTFINLEEKNNLLSTFLNQASSSKENNQPFHFLQQTFINLA